MAALHHGRSCAARERARGIAAGHSTLSIARAIVACCSVSALRAQRLARGWTLKEAAAELAKIAGQAAQGPRVDDEQLRLWETHPTRLPRAGTIDLLCRLYQTNPQELGLAGDYQPAAEFISAPIGAHHHVDVAAVSQAGLSSDPFSQALDAARRAVDRTLAAATVSAAQLDLLDERLRVHRHQYMTTTPLAMIEILLADLAEVHALASERQPASHQARLSEMTAVLATLVADALMKLGRLHQAQAWYGTARTAADDTANRTLRARVRVQAAMLPYYYGPLDYAVQLAREARQLTRGRPSATAAFAAAAEARALAQRRDAPGAAQAIHLAQQLIDYCDEGDDHDAWAFPRRRMLLYLSGAHTALGEVRKAREIQGQALQLYQDDNSIDPTLLRLEAAIGLALERSPGEACQMASAAVLQVPSGHRTPILAARAQHVITAIPQQMRRARQVRELGEVLALPPGRTDPV